MVQYLRRLALLFILVAASAATAADHPGIGRPARPFTITTFAKQKVKLADLRGKVVVINLWATWCAPCKEEMPMMDAVHRRFHDNGLEIYAIATEDSVPPIYLRRLSAALSFPLATKLSGSGYGALGGVPTTYVIDRAGNLRYAKSGAFNLQSFQAVILPLLRESPPA